MLRRWCEDTVVRMQVREQEGEETKISRFQSLLYGSRVACRVRHLLELVLYGVASIGTAPCPCMGNREFPSPSIVHVQVYPVSVTCLVVCGTTPYESI